MERVADDEQQRQERRRNRIRRRETRISRSSTSASSPSSVSVASSSAASGTSATSASSSASSALGRDHRILRILEPLSWLRRSERALLNHFATEACGQIVCSPHGHRTSLNLLVPLALQSPSLLYATLAYSAAQQASLRPRGYDDPAIPKYVGLSLAAFQTELPQSNRGSNTSLLAASLMLSLVSVSSGDIEAGSWRIYAEGAKALISTIRKTESDPAARLPVEIEDILRFLSRWYLTLESLACVTPVGLITDGEDVVQADPWEAPIPGLDGMNTLDLFDDHIGYPTGLAVVMRDIAASTTRRYRQLTEPPSDSRPLITQEEFEVDADFLQLSLAQTADSTVNSPTGLAFYPGVREELSVEDVQDFEACTRSYISMCSMLIERRVRGVPPNAPIVKASIQGILDAVAPIRRTSGSSAAVAITPPLFLAGCEAVDESDRCAIREAFKAFDNVKSHNRERCLRILEEMWAKYPGVGIDWLSYQKNRGWDFLPY